MRTTLQQVLDAARGILHDTDPSTGAVWTNASLQPHFERAYRSMYDAMSFGSNRIRREWYYVLEAYTSQLDPYAVGLTDISEPEFMEDRDAGTVSTITSTSNASPINVLAVAHGVATNDDVIVQSVNGTSAPIARWYATRVDADNLTLNGSVTDGAGGTGGFLSKSSDKFTEVVPIEQLSDRDISQRLGSYTWESNIFKFRGATTRRQIHVTYIASGTPPTNVNTVIGLDNCITFLSTAIAAFAAESNEWTKMAERLVVKAYGPKGEGDASGGYLRGFINAQVLNMQRQQWIMGEFRRPRVFPNPLY